MLEQLNRRRIMFFDMLHVRTRTADLSDAPATPGDGRPLIRVDCAVGTNARTFRNGRILASCTPVESGKIWPGRVMRQLYVALCVVAASSMACGHM